MNAFDMITYVQYNNWGNERLVATAEQIPPAQLRTGTAAGFTGQALLSNGSNGNLQVDSLLAVERGLLRYPNGVARTITTMWPRSLVSFRIPFHRASSA